MKSSKLLFFSIILAACLGQFASDIYIPALPGIATNLNTTISLVQWTIAVYLFGMAISMLIYGPLSEGIGRKKPMIIGLSIMWVGSVICLLAPNIQMLIIGRLIQGLGVGATTALWRSVFRDIFNGEQLAKYSSYLVIFVMFIIPVAPALGGYLQHYIGWRAIFAFITIYSTVALVLIIFGVKETHQHLHKDRLKISYIKQTSLTLLKSRLFLGTTLSVFLTYGAFFSWFTAGPVLLIHIAGLSVVAFGWFTFLGGGAAYALAGWLNGKLVTRFGISNMMRFGWAMTLSSGILLLIGKQIFGVNAWAIMLPIILFYFGASFIWPNAFAKAFTPFGHIAGYAGAFYGFIQTLGGAVIAGLISILPDKNQIPLAVVIILTSVCAWLIYELCVNRCTLQEPSDNAISA